MVAVSVGPSPNWIPAVDTFSDQLRLFGVRLSLSSKIGVSHWRVPLPDFSSHSVLESSYQRAVGGVWGDCGSISANQFGVCSFSGAALIDAALPYVESMPKNKSKEIKIKIQTV